MKWLMSNMPMSGVISYVIPTHFWVFVFHFTPFCLYQILLHRDGLSSLRYILMTCTMSLNVACNSYTSHDIMLLQWTLDPNRVNISLDRTLNPGTLFWPLNTDFQWLAGFLVAIVTSDKPQNSLSTLCFKDAALWAKHSCHQLTLLYGCVFIENSPNSLHCPLSKYRMHIFEKHSL